MNLPSIFQLVTPIFYKRAKGWLSSAILLLSATLPRFFSGQQISQPQTRGNNALGCIWENLITPIAAQPHRKRIDSNLSHHKIITYIVIDNLPLYNHVKILIQHNYDTDMYTDDSNYDITYSLNTVLFRETLTVRTFIVLSHRHRLRLSF